MILNYHIKRISRNPILASINSKMVAYWKFEEASGSILDSVAGLSGTGTGITYSVAAQIGNGISNDNVTGHGIVVPTDAKFNVTTGSLSVWINYSAGAYWINNMNSDADMFGWALQRSSTGGFNFATFLLGNGSGSQVITTKSYINVTTWYHLVVTWDGSTVNMYVNGTIDTSVAQTKTPAYTTFPLSFLTGMGSDGVTLKFPSLATIDEFSFYNAVLTDQEVRYLHNLYRNSRTYPFL